MPPCKGYQFHVVTHCDLFDWVKAKLLRPLFSQVAAYFLWEDAIYRYGCFGKLIMDGRLDNKDVVVELAERYEIKKIVIFAYDLKANRMIERGHKSIVDALSKMSTKGSTHGV